MAEGKSIQARIKAVSQMTFTDEDGQPRQFHLAHHLELVLPLPEAWRHRHGKPAPFRQGQGPQGDA